MSIVEVGIFKCTGVRIYMKYSYILRMLVCGEIPPVVNERLVTTKNVD